MGLPRMPTGPVRALMAPTLITPASGLKPGAAASFPAWPLEPASSSSPPQADVTSESAAHTATRAVHFRRRIVYLRDQMDLKKDGQGSVGERPAGEVGLDPHPDAGQTPWLEDQ